MGVVGESFEGCLGVFWESFADRSEVVWQSFSDPSKSFIFFPEMFRFDFCFSKRGKFLTKVFSKKTIQSRRQSSVASAQGFWSRTPTCLLLLSNQFDTAGHEIQKSRTFEPNRGELPYFDCFLNVFDFL